MHSLLVSIGGTGSTVLQRLITINYYLEDVKVQNTHDLVNKFLYHNEKQVVQRNGKIQYGQTLEEVMSVLETSNKNTMLVSRLSKDHLDVRKDDVKTTENFIEFVKKFYTKNIACMRDNVFEFAMSLAIKKESKIYNIFTNDQRKVVENVKKVDEQFFISQCKKYIEYHEWLDNYFPKIIKISYEDVINKSDEVLQNITGYRNTLTRYFGLPTSELLRLDHKKNLTNYEYKALELYKNLCDQLIKDKIFNEMPIKNTSLQDKKNQIENFDRCKKIFDQYTRKIDFIDTSITNFDPWNKKYVDNVS